MSLEFPLNETDRKLIPRKESNYNVSTETKYDLQCFK